MERRKSCSVRIGLIAAGANIVGSRKPAVAQKFIDQVNEKFGVDLKAVSTTGVAPETSLRVVNKITDLAPKAVIAEANKTVRVSDKKKNDADIKQSGQNAIQQLNDASQVGVANARLNGESVD